MMWFYHCNVRYCEVCHCEVRHYMKVMATEKGPLEIMAGSMSYQRDPHAFEQLEDYLYMYLIHAFFSLVMFVVFEIPEARTYADNLSAVFPQAFLKPPHIIMKPHIIIKPQHIIIKPQHIIMKPYHFIMKPHHIKYNYETTSYHINNTYNETTSYNYETP